MNDNESYGGCLAFLFFLVLIVGGLIWAWHDDKYHPVICLEESTVVLIQGFSGGKYPGFIVQAANGKRATMDTPFVGDKVCTEWGKKP